VVPAAYSVFVSPDVLAFRARTVGPKALQHAFVVGNARGEG